MGKIISYVLTSLLLAGYSAFTHAGGNVDVYICPGDPRCPEIVTSVSEPEMMLLLGVGIAAIAVVQRWRRRK
jgi:hypothetical protein